MIHYVLHDPLTGRIIQRGTCLEDMAPVMAGLTLQIIDPEEFDSATGSARIVSGKVVALSLAEQIMQARADAWSRIKAARHSAEGADFTWRGLTFDGDERSRARLLAAAQIGSGATWTLADDSRVALNGSELASLVRQRADEINVIHEHAATLRKQIASAATLAQVNVIVW